MNLHIITLVIILIIGIGIPNVLASDIASLNLTGNVSMILTPTPSPTPTPMITHTPSIFVPLDLSGADTNDRIIVNETIATVTSSIMVNFSSASDIETEYDEEEQRLSIEITEAEPNDEIAEGEIESEETEEVGEE